MTNKKKSNNNDTKSTTLAEPPMFLCGVPTVCLLVVAAWSKRLNPGRVKSRFRNLTDADIYKKIQEHGR